MENYKLTIKGETKEYPQGTTYLDLCKEYQDLFEYDIILAKINGKLIELFKEVDQDGEVEFITTANDIGMKTYKRGLLLVLLRAIYRVLDAEKIQKVRVEHSINSNIYCEIDADFKLTNEDIELVKHEMISLIERDLPFEKYSLKTSSAIKIFQKYKMYDKEKLFKYRRASRTNVYTLDGFVDYFYGFMPATTGVLKYFDIFLYNEGFVLQFPKKKKPDELKEFKPKEKYFKTIQESNKLIQTLGLETVGDLNEHITKGLITDIILVEEALQEKRIAQIAEQVKQAGGKKFIMIAGPSSSGKTTFSHRLSIQLRALGYKPHPIAVDNYFVNREDTPKDEDGNYNFECLEALDVKQFNEDMTNLLNGKEVDMPTFNFKAGKREYKGNILKLGKDDILVIEGIHCLNDALSYSLPKESKFKVYISALTQINIDEHNRIPTTDARILRRMVRDARTRGTGAQATIAMWPSVRKGEDENIFPYQEEADAMFNSALTYELCVLKQFAEPLLFGIDKESDEYVEANRLLKFLDYFLGVTSEDVPKNSILREFVGGSTFNV